MTRYLIGALAVGALLTGGCSKPAGSNYSGGQKQPGEYGSSDTSQKSGSSLSGAAQGAADGASGAAKDTANGVSGAASSAAGSASQTASGASKSLEGSKSISGTVTQMNSHTVTVKAANQSETKLNTGNMTQVSDAAGQKIDIANLPEGSRVKATYVYDGTQNDALKIQVEPPGKPADPGSPATP